MHQFGMREVEKLLHLPRSAIHGLIKAGFVAPRRGPRKAYLFSFQDLIVLRTAQALTAAQVPARRITRSLKALRRSLPATMPLSGLAIGAVGDRVVVKEGASRWQAESGQYLLAFDGDPADGSMTVVEPTGQTVSGPRANADDWYEKAHALEGENTEAARQAYERALAADPTHLNAHINLGRLLHEAGRLEAAERLYRRALAASGDDALLWYNLGVLLTDRDHLHEALQAYQRALRINPRMADCHYNMALLYKTLQQPKQALRYMAQYRRLMHKP
jgi:tetratricopeptide (TPR) repeat protein